MEIILLKDVEKVGLRGEVVSVARGYARNFLLPRKLAEVATPGRVAEVQRIETDRARHEARSAEQATDIAETLGKTVLRFDVKAGPTGSLFGSVTTTDIADEIWRTRKIRVDRRKIGVDSIKRIGRYSVPINVFEGVIAELKLMVVPEGGELPPEEELAAMEAAETAAAAEAAAESAAAHVAAGTALEIADEEAEAEAEAEAVEVAEAVEAALPADEPAADAGVVTEQREDGSEQRDDDIEESAEA
jgi:large subunit ribosomal protein L9